MSESYVLKYLTADFPYVKEIMGFFMACQGAIAVRSISASRKPKPFVWFHAFALSVVVGFGGACFTPLLLGRPTSMLSSDINFPLCFIAFYLVNYSPFDIVHKILTTFLGTCVVTIFAQLFRAKGISTFVNIAFKAFEESPSAYYSIPVVGPIAFATLLGNMGPFFVKGFHGHLEGGMPFGFQNGLFCASLYHFYSNDTSGVIGISIRKAVNMVIAAVPALSSATENLSDEVLAASFITGFMTLMGILQLPKLLGPKFSPFDPLSEVVVMLLGMDIPPGTAMKKNNSKSVQKLTTSEPAAQQDQAGKKKKKKKTKNA